MDLREISHSKRRHPWEVVRVQTLKNILKKCLMDGTEIKVLDVGCGDAFIANELRKSITLKSYDGVDIHFSNDQIIELSEFAKNFTFHKYLHGLKSKYYSLILVLDVIEHVEDDYAFLHDIVNKYVAQDAYILITVPAFNFYSVRMIFS
jgi:2-polyprenyl-3-methyl-5-hydroxy-6-metoxy-1,4-benzoquinol methylase